MRISRHRIDAEDGRIDNAFLKDYGETAVSANSTTAYTVDLESGNVFDITMTGNCTFTFSNPPASGTHGAFTLILTQDSTGSRTATWPAGVLWPGGTAPTLTTSDGRSDTLTFSTFDGGATWFGMLTGADMRAVVSIENTDTGFDTANLSTYTFSNLNLGAADSNREIFVAIVCGLDTARTVDSVTAGGETLNIDANTTSSSGSRHAVAYGSVPSGTSGDVVVTLSGGALSCMVSVYRVVSRAGSGDADGFGDHNGSGTSASVSSVTVEQDGFLLSTCITNGTGNATVSGGDMSEDIQDNAGGAHAIASSPIHSSSSTPTVTWSFSSGLFRMGLWSYS